MKGCLAVSIFDWITETFKPEVCNSEQFFYNHMDSQSGFSLPILYRPFDAGEREHWRDRGSLFDFLDSVNGEGKRLLDFGPGDGWPSLIVAPFAREVVGVDGSPKRVAVCAENAARLGLDNARFIHVEPGQPLPFPDGSFDGVMAASSVEQSPDPLETLRELYRILKPGGGLRLYYESLSIYAHGREQEADLEAAGASACWVTLYDRLIDREQVRMVRLKVAQSIEAARQHFQIGEDQALWPRLSVSRLEALKGAISETWQCTLTHPSSATYLAWMKQIGFFQAFTTHGGAWLAGQLFDQLPPATRPGDLASVDALLRPLVKIIIRLEAPLRLSGGFEPMITAVK